MAKPKTAIPFACPSRASRKSDETPPLPKPPPHLYEATEAATRMNLFFPSTQMKGCFPPWHPLPAKGKAYALTSLEDVVCKHLIINMSTTGGILFETDNRHRPVALSMSDVSSFPIDRLGFMTVSFQKGLTVQ